jgi:hypothetical protein
VHCAAGVSRVHINLYLVSNNSYHVLDESQCMGTIKSHFTCPREKTSYQPQPWFHDAATTLRKKSQIQHLIEKRIERSEKVFK